MFPNLLNKGVYSRHQLAFRSSHPSTVLLRTLALLQRVLFRCMKNQVRLGSEGCLPWKTGVGNFQPSHASAHDVHRSKKHKIPSAAQKFFRRVTSSSRKNQFLQMLRRCQRKGNIWTHANNKFGSIQNASVLFQHVEDNQVPIKLENQIRVPVFLVLKHKRVHKIVHLPEMRHLGHHRHFLTAVRQKRQLERSFTQTKVSNVSKQFERHFVVL
mmetsp:Transcript_3217/g.4599  ORF Transcript_3217/g.4599 Transcript_3217/m.4599 type:complete len:213 (-) Transcript_3217:641-1279(-)